MNRQGEWTFTSESVTEGHPDKVCDQISDAIVDHIISLDPEARIACETMCTTGMVTVFGEITTSAYVDIPRITRDTIRDIGYTGEAGGFSADTCAILTSIDEQSSDIALGVNQSIEARSGAQNLEMAIGAGDQGIMFGYANKDTEALMPLPIFLAHKVCERLALVRKENILPYLRPDGKSQVSVKYVDNQAIAVETVVLSSQHDANVEMKQMEKDLIEHVIKVAIPEQYLSAQTKILINPTGRFVIGGPQGDSGLTGRKIIVDTYGGFARHGGGAFSGKDPTKVDRTASYFARYIAKNIVAAGLASSCEIQLSYAIGVAEPTSIYIDTFETGVITDEKMIEIVKKNFDMRPAAMIKRLNLRNPIYKQVASYGHFGRPDLNLPWEQVDCIEELKKDAGIN